MERCIEPVCNTRLLSVTAFMTSMASWMLCVSGFSQYTSLPARKAASVMIACQWSGVAMQTASMSLRAIKLAKIIVRRAARGASLPAPVFCA